MSEEPSKPLFLCDAMLAKLARWLRIFGYDTELASNQESDLEILHRARVEERIVLTRDRRLGKHPGVILFRTSDTVKQMREVVEELGIQLPERPVPRYCSLCNGRLRDASPEELPQFVDKGWVCEGCGQQYWKGAHWKGIKEFVRQVREE